MVLLHPDLEIDVEAPIVKIERLVSEVGGKVIKRDNWGKKRLAYKIAKQDFAIYVYFEVMLDPAKVRELESTIRITEEVLRHILVVHEEPEQPTKKTEKADKEEKVEKSEKKANDTAKEEK